MNFIWLVSLIVAGQAIRYPVGCAIHMLDGKVEAGDVLPPLGLSTRQMGLSLKVFETLVAVTMTNLRPSNLSSHFINASRIAIVSCS